MCFGPMFSEMTAKHHSLPLSPGGRGGRPLKAKEEEAARGGGGGEKAGQASVP